MHRSAYFWMSQNLWTGHLWCSFSNVEFMQEPSCELAQIIIVQYTLSLSTVRNLYFYWIKYINEYLMKFSDNNHWLTSWSRSTLYTVKCKLMSSSSSSFPVIYPTHKRDAPSRREGRGWGWPESGWDADLWLRNCRRPLQLRELQRERPRAITTGIWVCWLVSSATLNDWMECNICHLSALLTFCSNGTHDEQISSRSHQAGH